jgi:hypothetical protein
MGHQRKPLVGFLLTAFFTLYSLCAAKDIYVNNTVGSSGDGSIGSPYKTVQEGLDSAVAGDNVIVRGNTTGQTYSENIVFPRAGSAGSPITLKTILLEKAVISHSSWILLDKNFITIEGLIFDHKFQDLDAIVWSGGNCIMRRCELKNGIKDGIDFRPPGKDNLVEGCVIHDFKTIPRSDCHGIVTTPPFYNLRLIKNTIYNCSGDCLQTYANDTDFGSAASLSTNLLVEGNILYTTLGANSENAIDLKDGSFITIRNNEMYGFTGIMDAIVAQKYHKNMVIDGNIIHDSFSGIECRGEPEGLVAQTNITVVRNVFYNVSDYAVKFDGVVNGNIINNTISKASSRSIFSERKGWKTGSFRNNLIHNSGPGDISGTFSGVTLSNNGWFGSSPGDLTGTSDVTGSDPKFVNATAHDYHLQSTSTAINKGASIGYPSIGLPDLGAYEFGFTSTEDGKVHVVATDPTAMEAGLDPGSFTISRAPAGTSSLTVKFAVAGKASKGNDYTTLPTSVVIPAGSTSVTIPVTPLQDSTSEGNEDVVVTLTPDAAYEISLDSSAKVIIWDDEAPSPPEVSISVGDAKGGEPGTDTASFIFTRAPTSTGDLTVNYLVGGSAANGSDYNALPGSIVIPAGSFSQVLTITPKDDALGEGKEIVVLQISPSSSYTIVQPPEAFVTIMDNEPPPVSIVATDATASENAGDTGTFTVSITDEMASNLNVKYTVSGTATPGSDYTTLTGTVQIPTGQTSATILVSPLTDSLVESQESVIVSLSPDAAYTLGTPNSSTIQLSDKDRPQVYCQVSSSLLAEPSTKGSFRVGRSGSIAGDVTVLYKVTGTASNGVDYVSISGSCLITNGSSSVVIDITPKDDLLKEGDESVNISIIDNPADYGIYSETYRSASLILKDNDVPLVTMATTDQYAFEPGFDTGAITVTRAGDTTDAITVNYTVSGTASNGVDYVTLPGSITIPAGATSQEIIITAKPDSANDNLEYVQLFIAPGVGYSASSPNSAYVYVNNPAPIVALTAPDNVASESGSDTGTFLVTRSSTNSTTTIFYTISGTASNGVDYTSITNFVTFTPGVTNKNIVIAPKSDSTTESPETVTLKLNPSSAYMFSSDTATVTISESEATPIAASLEVSPTNTWVAPSTTRTFTAVVKDQFGNPMVPQPTFTWSVTTGGTINSSGVFTAGSALGGPHTITVSASGFTETATVRIGTDSNSDTLPDEWQIAYFGSATSPNAAPSADPDKDGYTNEQEFKAGTIPTDSNDRLAFGAQTLLSDGTFQFNWQSVSGVSYQVESSVNLSTWTPLATVVGGASGTSSYTDPTPGAKKYYRIRIP